MSHWSVNTLTNMVYIELPGFHLEDDQGVCRQEDNWGTHWLLKDAQVTQRFLMMKSRPCVSYCGQKNLSEIVAEHENGKSERS